MFKWMSAYFQFWAYIWTEKLYVFAWMSAIIYYVFFLFVFFIFYCFREQVKAADAASLSV